MVARYHQVAADPATLAHQLGLAPSAEVSTQDMLRAAKHLGLQAKLTRSSAERLKLIALPALALMQGAGGVDGTSPKVVVLAQTDGQRVLLQLPGQGSRPTIESLDTFTQQWSGQLILITSRASLAGALLGGTGVDDLFGGEGNDVLDGGAGNDTYQLTTGELFDVVTDSDGNGTNTVDGVQLTGGKKAAEGYWISDDKQWGYVLSSAGDLTSSKGSNLHDGLIIVDCAVLQEENLITKGQFYIENKIYQKININLYQNALIYRQSLHRANKFSVTGNRV